MFTSGTRRGACLVYLVFCGALIAGSGCGPGQSPSPDADRPSPPQASAPKPVSSPVPVDDHAAEKTATPAAGSEEQAVVPGPGTGAVPPPRALPGPAASAEPMPTGPPTGAAGPATDSGVVPPKRPGPAGSPQPPTRNPLRQGSTDSRPRDADPIRPGKTPGAVTPGPQQPAAESPRSEQEKPAPAPAKKPFAGGKHSGRPFDPIKENGTIFEGWTRPKLALVISGRQEGYLEPCGCAGLDRMKGGLSRRHTMLNQLRAKGWPLVELDVGGLVNGFGRQAELKFQTTVEAMRQMGYDAIALGKTDLRFPAAELLSVVASLPETPSPFVSANVAVFGFDAGLTGKSRVIEAGGMKIGVTSVLGMKWQAEINNAEIEMADPKEKLAELLPQLEPQCDLLVLLAHATKEESIELARAFPQFDVVVSAGGPPEPPARPEPIEGLKPLLVEVGEKGMNVVVLGLFDDSARPIRYQRVPLDSRFGASDEMKLLMAQYQDQLRRDGFQTLGIRAVPHPQKDLLGAFVGSKKCADCHEPSYDVWKKTGHARAWETLKQLDPPRNFDPECISCHVIGWHPTKHFPYETGFWSEDTTPALTDVGCESCHGPGKNHVKAEMGSDLELQEKLQKAMVVTKQQSRQSQVHWCLNCHDLDNSPDFDFDAYWPQVEHHEDL